MDKIFGIVAGTVALVVLVFVLLGVVTGAFTSTPVPTAPLTITTAIATGSPAPKTIAQTSTPTPTTRQLRESAGQNLEAVARAQFGPTVRVDPIDQVDVTQVIAGFQPYLTDAYIYGTPSGLAPTPFATPTQALSDEWRGYATVTYDLPVQPDDLTTVRMAAEAFKQFAPKAFAIVGVDRLTLSVVSQVKDDFGNTATGVAIKFTISRETAQGINWATIDPRNFRRTLIGQFDGVTFTPALKDAWTRYAS